MEDAKGLQNDLAHEKIENAADQWIRRQEGERKSSAAASISLTVSSPGKGDEKDAQDGSARVTWHAGTPARSSAETESYGAEDFLLRDTNFDSPLSKASSSCGILTWFPGSSERGCAVPSEGLEPHQPIVAPKAFHQPQGAPRRAFQHAFLQVGINSKSEDMLFFIGFLFEQSASRRTG